MCVVSMVMDHYWEKWKPLTPGDPGRPLGPPPFPPAAAPPITQDEILEFRRLLERAREYDKRNNEPDCEMEEKKRRLQDLADELGVSINFD
jgi:hypothetical protein